MGLSIKSRSSHVRVLLFAVLVVSSLIISSPAFAHSDLQSTDPVANSVLTEIPAQITLTFNTDVDIVPTSIRIYDGDGNRVAENVSPQKSSSNVVFLSLPPLENDNYAVAWNVTSADGHPIKGSFAFAVDVIKEVPEPARESLETFENSPTIKKIIAGQTISDSVRTTSFVFRITTFLSLAIIVAGVIMKKFILGSKFLASFDKWFYGATIVCAISSLGNVVALSAATRQISLTSALNPSSLVEDISTVFGLANLLRVILCIVVAVSWKFLSSRIGLGVALVSVAILGMTPALSGHARSGDYVVLAMAASWIHVVATFLWFGGLVILLYHRNVTLGVEPYQRFSRLAFWCVVAIAISGAFAWWRQVGSPEALDTWFGQLVMMKSIMFIAVIVVAFFSRQYVKKMVVDNDESATQKILRRSIFIEAIIIILIYGATSILINTIPARDALAVPVTKTATTQVATVEFTADPAKSGPSDLHVYVLTTQGTPMNLVRPGRPLSDPKILVTFTNKKEDVGPVEVPMRFQGLNHFSSVGLNVPLEGTWTVTATIDLTEYDSTTASVDINYR